jgi:hypothetical protein
MIMSGWEHLMSVATSGDGWRTGVRVRVSIIVYRTVNARQVQDVEVKDGVLNAMAPWGITITNRQGVMTLYPWHRVSDVVRVEV